MIFTSIFLLILSVTKIAGFFDELPKDGCNTTLYRSSGSFWYYNLDNTKTTDFCQWRIAARYEERIILSINMDIPKSPNCISAYLEVRDGNWPNSPLLGKFCGSGRLHQPIISTGRKMFISYYHNNLNTRAEFFARYQSICGGALYVEDEISLKSHSSVGNYPPDKECVWHIEVPEKHTVFLHFQRFDLEDEENCSYDYVEILDGSLSNATSLGKFCGDEIPRDLTSTSNIMTIIFRSDNTVQEEGFLATITSNYDKCAAGYHNCAHECVNTISYYGCACRPGYELQADGRTCELPCGDSIYVEDEINLKSHESEGNYSANRECIWNIAVSQNHRILLHFYEFDLEDGENCSYDYVEILDGPINNATLLGRFCGDEIPRDLISSSNILTIKFVSDDSVQKGGFLATILAEYDQCATGEHDCAHECIKTNGYYECACRSGYELQADGTNCELSCGGTLYAPSGVINSPSYPERYSSNKTCTWEIIAPEENLITLTFTHFDVEGNVTHLSEMICDKDKVEVFEKSDHSTKLIGTYCGSILPNGIVSKTNKLQIDFVSDGDTERTGFSLNYRRIVDHCSTHSSCHHSCETTLTDSSKCICEDDYLLQENNLDCKKDVCHYEISSKSGVISSPNYPNVYPPNLNCTWRFKTTPGHKLVIEFHDLLAEVRSSGGCYDYVNLYDGGSLNSPILGEFCGLSNGNSYESTTNEMYMQFRTDHSNQYRGFRANYSSKCNSTLMATDENKYIFSHVGYSFTDYQNNVDCEWTIVPTAGYRTILKIEILNIENSDNCEYDYLEIFDGNYSLGKYCGNNKSSFTSNNNFKVRFHSDSFITRKGFRIMYKTANDWDDESVTTTTAGTTTEPYFMLNTSSDRSYP